MRRTSAVRSRTLCAPGFFFLMGMGTVYLHRSRTRLGWSSARLARHFGVRALALTAVSEVMGWLLMRGRGALVINIVLIGLAVDYLLTGLLCLLVQKTEKAAAVALDRWQGDKQQSNDSHFSPGPRRAESKAVKTKRARGCPRSVRRRRRSGCTMRCLPC